MLRTWRAFILDNPSESDRFVVGDAPVPGSAVIRVSLRAHASDRRDVLIAQVIDRFAQSVLRDGEWRTLQRVELDGSEVRIVAHENGRRYAEYFTLDGIPLERQQLAGSR